MMLYLPNIGSIRETDIVGVPGLVSVQLPKENEEYSNKQAWCSG